MMMMISTTTRTKTGRYVKRSVLSPANVLKPHQSVEMKAEHLVSFFMRREDLEFPIGERKRLHVAPLYECDERPVSLP